MSPQHPQYRFLSFKRANDGKYEIPELYDELIARKRKENEKEIEFEFVVGPMTDETHTKITNRLDEVGLLSDYTPDDVSALHRRDAKSTERYDVLDHKLRNLMFAKATSRQNLGEEHTENCFEHVHNNVPEFKWKKLAGKKSRWIDSGGNVVSEKPANAIEIKSLDYFAQYDETEMYIAQKRMKISDGGHQNNQTGELYRFAKETASAKDFIPVAILDGALQPKAMAQITQLNDKIVLLQSNDFHYFIKWLEQEATKVICEPAEMLV
jgi:hypothetical protein